MIGIGIDTGGTYTDAVVVNTDTLEVLAKAKALTTKEDLAIGIGNALDALPANARTQAERISLSTTLATNACVEGKGGRAKLIIIGTTADVLHRVNADKVYGIPYADVLPLDFAGSYDGKEAPEPNWEEICDAHASFFEDADSFGITGLYALNNGATVERSGAEYLQRRYGKLVVKATDVATAVNVIERGATALLNARLVPVIQEFLDAIREALTQRGLNVPVSVMRSDGTLMSEELARLRPVETILSGPAASVRGAQTLAPAAESLVVDIGGTTSDVSIFHDGAPVRTDHIRIGGWQTQVSGVAINTIGLGGDSAARYTTAGTLELSQRRVLPLCIAASRWDMVIPSLERYIRDAYPNYHSKYEILYLAREPRDLDRFTSHERELIELLREGPLALHDERHTVISGEADRLEAEGVVMRAGMTPTDAMHILGDFTSFNREASVLGARAIQKSRTHASPGTYDEDCAPDLARKIYELAQRRLFGQLGSVLMQDSYWPDGPAQPEEQTQLLLQSTWEAQGQATGRSFTFVPNTNATLVGIGAPTHVMLPAVARALNACEVLPEHAEVANAIGAICSKIVVDSLVRVVPERSEYGTPSGYRVLSVNSALTFGEDELVQAMETGRNEARLVALAEARLRGITGDAPCTISEEEIYSVGAADHSKVIFEWQIRAHVEA